MPNAPTVTINHVSWETGKLERKYLAVLKYGGKQAQIEFQLNLPLSEIEQEGERVEQEFQTIVAALQEAAKRP